MARLLVAAERRERVEGAAVDLDLPGAHPPRDALGALRVGRPDAAGEAVDRVVGDPDRVVLVVVGDDRQHRAEDLLLGDRHVGARRRRRRSAARSSRCSRPSGGSAPPATSLRALLDALAGCSRARARAARRRPAGRAACSSSNGSPTVYARRPPPAICSASVEPLARHEHPGQRAAGLAGVEEALARRRR